MARHPHYDTRGNRRPLWSGRLLAPEGSASLHRGASIGSLCAAAAGLVSLGFYLMTLAPGLTWAYDSADGGELAAAARTLGIPHPPGYPTYVLLAHLFTRLPVREVATRTNLFSAICAAGAAALLSWALARLTYNWVAATSAGLALALSPLLWQQAIVTEVHALNALFTALLLAFMVQVTSVPRRPPQRAALLALAVGSAWGLSLGNHPTALFCGTMVILTLWHLRRSGLWGATGVALGLLIYLYLPLRAAADPPVNWGDPQTLPRFWWMISGGPYHQFVFSLPGKYLPRRLLGWVGLLTQQFSGIGLAVTGLGAAMLWLKERSLFGATAALVILCSAFATWYNTTDSYLYLMPALVCLGLWLGLGIDWLIGTLAARARWAAVGAAALVALSPLIAGVARIPKVDLRDDRAADVFEAAVLAPAPPEAVILSQRDAHTFSLWYAQHALGHRPDVVVVDIDLLGYDWYVAQLSRRLLVPPPVELLQAVEGFHSAAEMLARPICQIKSEPAGLLCVAP